MRWRRQGAVDVKTGWLTTFNDLMTLLLVFFVMIFAMSSKDTQMMRRFQQAMQEGRGVLEGQRGSPERQGPATALSPGPPDGAAIGMNAESILALASAAGIAAERTSGDDVRLTLENQVLFAFGQAEILPEGIAEIERLGKLLAPLPVAVQIEGHTDNIPIGNPHYPSNWELSTARAVNVLKVLAGRGNVDPRRLSAVGYGDARPLVPNDTAGHQARNRRVQVIVETEKGK